MVDGKKSTAEKIVYGALELLLRKQVKTHLEVFESALKTFAHGRS